MSWFSEFLHPNQGYKDAQKELEKYFQQAQQYQQPYMQQGQEAYGGLNNAMNALLNPEELYNKWAQSYQESPATQMAKQEAQNLGLDAASSMGLMGSSPALQAIQAGTAKIGAQGRQDYLDNLMQKYLAGAGIAQGVYGTGANAAGQLGQNAMNMGQNAGQLKFGEKSAQGNLFGNLLGTGAGYLGGLGSQYLMNKWNPMGNMQQPSGWSPMPNYQYGYGR